MKAYVFPGQGAQFCGMGKDLYESYPVARDLFEQANDILGFRITDIMFGDDAEALKQTRVTQPAVFLHSTITSKVMSLAHPDMVAGHSLGEYSALVNCEALSFEDALRLVSRRAIAMQKACEQTPSTMAAILGMADEQVDEICREVSGCVVVAANFNCPGQVVISGDMQGIDAACELLKSRGAKRAIRLQVGGAFHSPIMQPAAEELTDAIMATEFHEPVCPIYQNVNAYPQTNPDDIRRNLLLQLTAPVRWTQTIKNMIIDGATEFHEFGPGDVLKNLIKKIDGTVTLY
ncbi:MAG: ACP S-malonyltransferase [Paludibacteraceae bacterium]|nr:ACP S-malonyltransferase [Paludibacteraceae bacterium]